MAFGRIAGRFLEPELEPAEAQLMPSGRAALARQKNLHAL
jgi:hypothetical protein